MNRFPVLLALATACASTPRPADSAGAAPTATAVPPDAADAPALAAEAGGDADGTIAETTAEPAAALEGAAVNDAPPLRIDLHADVIYRLAEHGRALDADEAQWNPARAREAHQAAQFFPLWVPAHAADPAATLKRQARLFDGLPAAAPEVLRAARTADEIRAVAAQGFTAALLAIEGADGLGDDPAAIEPYVARGLRYLGLTWNGSNAFAEAAADPREPAGLTTAGRELVRRCNEAGVLVDLAHASRTTFWDALAVSRAPLLVSHAGLYALRPIDRNVDDLQLLALARGGGVLGLVFHSAFLAEGAGPEERAPLATLLDHLDHARALGAARALAIGSDFDGGIRPPAELRTVADLPRLEGALAERGWSDLEIRGVMGENVLRLLDAADAARGESEAGGAVRERPAELEVEAELPEKEAAALVDRRILPGPRLEGGVGVTVRPRGAGTATATALELRGAPGGVFEVRLEGGESRRAELGEDGGVRLEWEGGRFAAASVATAGGGAARLDEVILWVRGD